MKVYLERGRIIPSGRSSKRRRRDVRSRFPTPVVALILSALVFSACGPSTAQPTELPAATPTEVVLEAPHTAEPAEAPVATPTRVATEQPTSLPIVRPTSTPPSQPRWAG